jgi:hypothetical protein
MSASDMSNEQSEDDDEGDFALDGFFDSAPADHVGGRTSPPSQLPRPNGGFAQGEAVVKQESLEWGAMDTNDVSGLREVQQEPSHRQVIDLCESSSEGSQRNHNSLQTRNCESHKRKGNGDNEDLWDM